MECEVRFFGGISKVAGYTEAVTVRFNGSKLGELLDHIQAIWPGTVEFINGPKNGSIILVLNDTVLNTVDRNLSLKAGDKLAFMPFIAGG